MLAIVNLLKQLRSTPSIKIQGMALVVVPLMSVAAMASSVQLSAEKTLDHFFLSDEPIPGASAQEHEGRLVLRETVTRWLGNYKGVQTEDEHYRVLFEQGSIPVTVQFREDGNPDSITVVDCPVTSIPISQAPPQYREVLSSDCPDLIP